MRYLCRLTDTRNQHQVGRLDFQFHQRLLQYLENRKVPATRTPRDIYLAHLKNLRIHRRPLQHRSQPVGNLLSRKGQAVVFQNPLINIYPGMNLYEPTELTRRIVLDDYGFLCPSK